MAQHGSGICVPGSVKLGTVWGHTLSVEMGGSPALGKSNLVQSNKMKGIYIIQPSNPPSAAFFHGNESPGTEGPTCAKTCLAALLIVFQNTLRIIPIINRLIAE